MQGLKSLANYFSYSSRELLDDESANKVLFINLFSIFSFFLFISLGIIAFICLKPVLASILLVAAVLVALNFLYLRQYTKGKPAGHVLVTIITAVFIYYLAIGGITGSGVLLAITYPAIAVLMMGPMAGSVITLFFLLVCVLLFLLPFIPIHSNAFIHDNFVSAIASYLVVYFIVYFYHTITLRNLQKFEKEMLQAKIESKRKDDFISKLSHQIRTPLNNLMVANELLEETTLDENQKDLLNTLIASTNGLVSIVNNIARVSNIELTEQKDYSLNFNIYSTIQNTLKLFRDRLSDRIETITSFDNKVKTNVVGDPVRLKQVFINIIENISRYISPKKGFIQVKVNLVEESEKFINLAFEIKTVPLPASLIRLGKPSENKESDENDTAIAEEDYLDFSTARNLIESKGGRLSIKTNDQGTIFEFTIGFSKLQYAKHDYIKEQVQPLLTSLGSKSARDLNNASVLVVEDNLINQKIVVLSLKKIVKSIDIANNGREALEKFGAAKFDLILMDIQMPVMDGIIATKKIREIEGSTGTFTPIIAITANALSGDKEICLAAGANDYLSKPFQIDMLIQKMKALLTQNSI